MSSRSSNTTAVPEAKGALDRFKYEVANELGVPLTNGYNGNLTSNRTDSVGGYMDQKRSKTGKTDEQQITEYHAVICENRQSKAGAHTAPAFFCILPSLLFQAD